MCIRDAYSAVRADIPSVLFGEESNQLRNVFGPRFEFLPCVDVLRVLTEDDHVDQFGMLHGRRDTRVPADRAKADIQIEDLTQRDIEASNPAADGSRERTLDPDE